MVEIRFFATVNAIQNPDMISLFFKTEPYFPVNLLQACTNHKCPGTHLMVNKWLGT